MPLFMNTLVIKHSPIKVQRHEQIAIELTAGVFAYL